MKSWSQRELALGVLVIFAAPAVPYVTFRLLGDLMSLFFGTVPLISTLLSLFLYACISALVTGVPFFLWARRGSEYVGVLLLYLIMCYQGMLLGVALAAAAAWVLRKISGRKRP